jgi:hypothetical protein
MKKLVFLLTVIFNIGCLKGPCTCTFSGKLSNGDIYRETELFQTEEEADLACEIHLSEEVIKEARCQCSCD